MPDWRVGIVGGGIGGLTLAACLRARGIEAEGVELAPAFAPVGAGIGISANGFAILAALGQGEALESAGQALWEAKLTDAPGRRLAGTDFRAVRERFGPSVAVHRADLHQVLLAAAGEPGFRLGTTVEALAPEPGGVQVRFSDGREDRYDLLVGCDGIGSRVRELAGLERERRYSGYTCWRLAIDHPGAHALPMREMWGRGKRFGVVPIGRDRVYCFATANAPRGEADPRAGRAERMRARFAEFCEPVGAILAAASDEDVHHDDIDELADGPWRAGRVLLLGDAAHALTPNMGQGASMAMEDAWVLAERLAACTGPTDLEGALAGWEAERRPRVRKVQERSRRLGQVGQWRAPWACWLRDRAMALAPDRAALRALLTLLEEAPAFRTRGPSH